MIGKLPVRRRALSLRSLNSLLNELLLFPLVSLIWEPLSFDPAEVGLGICRQVDDSLEFNVEFGSTLVWKDLLIEDLNSE